MTNIHEEAQFCIAHLFGVDMFLEAQTVFLLASMGYQKLPEDGANHEEIEAIRPCRAVPRTMYDDGKHLLRRCLIVAYGLYTETVGTRWQVRESDFVDTWLQAGVFFTVDTIEIGDMFGTIVSQCRELEAEIIVMGC